MQDDIDFAALYDELGLSADCPLDSLKHAYRRRVRELHPDLPGATGSVEQLQRVNRLYAAALDFERRHGRLPGAFPVGVAPTRPRPAPPVREVAAPRARALGAGAGQLRIRRCGGRHLRQDDPAPPACI